MSNNLEITNSGYVKRCQVEKGSVETITDLPTNGNTENDVYYVKSEDLNYIWNGNAWEVNRSDIDLKGEKGDPGTNGTSAGFGTPTASVDNNVGTPSVTVTASGSNTAKIFNFVFKNLKGVKGDKGDKGDTGATGEAGATGPQGPKGDSGATGTRGSRWSTGTAITGTSTTATIFSGSGITDALVNDMYLNTSTGYVYKCTVSGKASVAKWIYAGSIKGPSGSTDYDLDGGTP